MAATPRSGMRRCQKRRAGHVPEGPRPTSGSGAKRHRPPEQQESSRARLPLRCRSLARRARGHWHVHVRQWLSAAAAPFVLRCRRLPRLPAPWRSGVESLDRRAGAAARERHQDRSPGDHGSPSLFINCACDLKAHYTAGLPPTGGARRTMPVAVGVAGRDLTRFASVGVLLQFTVSKAGDGSSRSRTAPFVCLFVLVCVHHW